MISIPPRRIWQHLRNLVHQASHPTPPTSVIKTKAARIADPVPRAVIWIPSLTLAVATMPAHPRNHINNRIPDMDKSPLHSECLQDLQRTHSARSSLLILLVSPRMAVMALLVVINKDLQAHISRDRRVDINRDHQVHGSKDLPGAISKALQVHGNKVPREDISKGLQVHGNRVRLKASLDIPAVNNPIQANIHLNNLLTEAAAAIDR